MHVRAWLNCVPGPRKPVDWYPDELPGLLLLQHLPRNGYPPVVTRLSQLFLRTLREDPVDAEVASHRLLVRAGYIRRADADPVGEGADTGMRGEGRFQHDVLGIEAGEAE